MNGEYQPDLIRLRQTLMSVRDWLERAPSKERRPAEQGFPLADVQTAIETVEAMMMDAVICPNKADPGSVIWLDCQCGWKGASEEAGYDEYDDEYRCPECGSGSDYLKARLEPGWCVLATRPGIVRIIDDRASCNGLVEEGKLAMPDTPTEYLAWIEDEAVIQESFLADDIREHERSQRGAYVRDLHALARALRDVGIEPISLPWAA